MQRSTKTNSSKYPLINMHLFSETLFIIAQIILIAAAADFISGIIHWLEDAYFSEDTPIIGKRLIKPNIVHHHLPRYFTKLSWWHSSHDLAAIGALVLLASWPLGFFGWQICFFVVLSVNANQIHKWAHRSRRENGRLISLLQDWRILQTPHQHGLHHTDPKNTYYCPITNYVNPVLEKIRFWDRAEALIEKLTGIKHRDDTSVRGQGPGPHWLDEYLPVSRRRCPGTCGQCPTCQQRFNPTSSRRAATWQSTPFPKVT